MDTLKRIRLTIGTKLVSLIGLLLIASSASLVLLGNRVFEEDNRNTLNATNAEAASNLATLMRDQFTGLNEKVSVLGTILIQNFQPKEARDRMVSEFFEKDKDLLAVVVFKMAPDGSFLVQERAISRDLVTMGDPQAVKAQAALVADKYFSMTQVARGEPQISAIKFHDGSPVIALTLPFVQIAPDKFSHTITCFVKQAKFVKAFTVSDLTTSFMVDRRGKLLAHPDAARVAAGENMSHLAIVKEMLVGKAQQKALRYIDGDAQLGAFSMIGFAGTGVVVSAPEAKALAPAYAVKYRSILLASIILCIAFFTGYLYSNSITWPIKNLVAASGRVAEGDFNINLKVYSQDEIGHLSLAFNDMARGLAERDRVKETFNKFHNKEIADKLMSGEVNLGGERRDAVIFFSDVRGFTALSETMSPEQVVEMLNEYMTRMVAIIRAHRGIVDKYVGDAIMAIWGVPSGTDDDVFNALGACLAMREDLAKLNELRLSRGQPVLKIGMGLNMGSVIAGNIGSVEKMEYTVIGDSVNLASRIESMTKEYGTDLLVSSSIYERVEKDFIFKQVASAKVKGKSAAVELYQVRGFYDENGKEIIVETPYSSYKAEKSDKAVHDDKPKADVVAATTKAPPPAMKPPVMKLPTPVMKSVPKIETTATLGVANAEPAQAEEAQAVPLITIDPDAAQPMTPLTESTNGGEAASNGNLFNVILETPPQVDEGQGPYTADDNTMIFPASLAEPSEAPPNASANLAADQANAKEAAGQPLQWYLQIEGEFYGPFDLAEMESGIESGEIGPYMQACLDINRPVWAPVQSYSQLRSHFTKTIKVTKPAA